MQSTDVKSIYVASASRTSGTAENFTITNVPSFTNNPISAKILNACIPNTWYNVNAPGNSLVFSDSVPTAYSVTITPGYYTGATLAAALQTAMNAVGSADAFTVTYSTTTYKTTFATTGANMTLDFTAVPNLAKQLGFVSGVIYGPLASITSVNTVNLILFTEIFICSDLVQGSDNGVIPWIAPSPPSWGVFARIPVRSCFGEILDYRAATELPYFSVVQSTFAKTTDPNNDVPRSMRFSLKFPDNTDVLLNGYDWSMEILFNFND